MNPYRLRKGTNRYIDYWTHLGHGTFPVYTGKHLVNAMGAPLKRKAGDIFGEFPEIPQEDELSDEFFERLASTASQASYNMSQPSTPVNNSHPTTNQNLVHIDLITPDASPHPERVTIELPHGVLHTLQKVDEVEFGKLRKRFSDMDKNPEKFMKIQRPWTEENFWDNAEVNNVIVFQTEQPNIQLRLYYSSWYNSTLVVMRRKNQGKSQLYMEMC